MSSNSAKLLMQSSQSEDENQVDQHENNLIQKVQIKPRSKKIQKTQQEQIKVKQLRIDQISKINSNSPQIKMMNLREQTLYDFDFLKIDKELQSNQTQIIIEDKKTKKKFVLKPIQNTNEIIDKLFKLNSRFILTPKNIFSYQVQSQKIDYLAKEIKIIYQSFQLLLFQCCCKSILHTSSGLSNSQIKKLYSDIYQGLMSAKENQLVLSELSLDSIVYCEENQSFMLSDYINARIGDNQINVSEFGMCLAQLIQQMNQRKKLTKIQINLNEWISKYNNDPFTNIILEMIRNEKSLQEIDNQFKQIDC